MKKLFPFLFISILIISISISAAPGEDFSLILLPDTQNESLLNPAAFNSQTQWIVNNKTTQNIVFVTHVGDIVNTASSAFEFNNADAAMDLLDAGNVAYSVGPGNHDMGTGSLYETYFGISRFSVKSWYGGYYGGNNYNNYSLFSASEMDFILINLQYGPTAGMLDWADALLKANPNRRGIVESHDILKVDDSWSNQGIYTALKDNPNLFLMVCGHMHTFTDGAAYRAELGDDGHTIHIMLADYQLFSLTGNGYLRILRFSPANDKIYATTYSPYVNKYITSYPDQMEMTYDMISGDERILLATNVFLEGPYDPNNNEMTISLNSGNYIPQDSPYNEDFRTVTSVPTTATDWVLVQLRSTYDGLAVASKSAFLHKDGRIVADDGITGQIEMTALPGSYYIVIKHRNHLAVISSSVTTFVSPPLVTAYDFTTGDGSQFYPGNGDGAKLLETIPTNVWGMIAGNADNSDQDCFPSDLAIIKSGILAGASGYILSDTDMDGDVFPSDYAISKINVLAGYSSSVP